ncbi:hypothetical protein GCM10011507_30950 [Edaphobacter acidisoli]|uniref:HTH tetR-type domain-containing protein n=1 Tax=Edaphobacter acidisoli TaxID=2040573 RepID=A0A916W8C8_9BACT|nr:TetR/AcrR family transcriptional regulator [Edaphobacter acidisoli]GGA77485.1 hypothetical protein GCM10011507_30950 [Edaphobacter acidisoli]
MIAEQANSTTSEKIAECALRILEAEGAQAVSMRRVAGEVGVTAMAIYHHFANREALLNQVVEREFARLVDFFDRTRVEAGFEAQMLGLLDGYVDYALAHPRIFDYVFAELRPGARRFPEDFRARKSPTLTPIADTLAYWMKQKRLKRDDVWEVAMELWAHVHGYLALYRGGRFAMTEKEFRALVRRSLERLLNGLRA